MVSTIAVRNTAIPEPEPSTTCESVTTTTCELITTVDRLREIMPAWDQLWREVENPVIFTSAGWVRAWMSAFEGQFSLCTPTIWSGKQLLAVLPLVKMNGAIRFMGHPLSDYNDLLCQDVWLAEAMRLLLPAVIALVTERRCVLENIAASSTFLRGFAHVPLWQKYAQIASAAPCPTISIGDDGGAVLDELMRKSCLRRPNNKFNKSGKACFRHLVDPQEAAAHMELFFEEQVLRRALAGKGSRFSDPVVKVLFRNLLTHLDLGTELRFAVLELNDEPVAHSIGFQLRGKFHWYQQAFNVNHWEYSPGDVLLRHLLEYAKQSRLIEYDFGRGTEAYKDRFTNNKVDTFRMIVERPTIANRVRRVGRTLNWKARILVKQNATILRLARGMRDVFGSQYTPSDGQSPTGRTSHKLGGWLSIVDGLRRKQRGVYWKMGGGIPANIERAPISAAPCNGGVRQAKLADFANLAVKHRSLFSRQQLQDFRTRLRRGERCYLDSDGVGFELGWLRDAANDDHSKPSAVLYDLMVFPANAQPRLRFLPACQHSAQQKGTVLVVHAFPNFREALERAGFERLRKKS